jgi:hypothetical protein
LLDYNMFNIDYSKFCYYNGKDQAKAQKYNKVY